jgi:hypothetical protein
MLATLRQERLLPSTSAFAESHCRTCAAGWTRTAEGGRAVIVCLLDREPVWQDMTGCDRYEAKEEAPAELGRQAASPAKV